MSRIGLPQWCVALVLAGGAHALLLDTFAAKQPGTRDPGGGGIWLTLWHGADRPGGPAAQASAPLPESPPPAPEGTPAEGEADAEPETEDRADAETATEPGAQVEADAEAGAMDSNRMPETLDGNMMVEIDYASSGDIVTERPVPKPDVGPPDTRVDALPPNEDGGRHEGAETAAAQAPVLVSSPSQPGSFDGAGRRGEPGANGVDSAVRGYLLLVQSEFNQRKHYPHDAYSHGAEGTVRLRFVVARSGAVLSYEIARSSGHAALDREVEALMRRVQPLPPFPPTIERERLELVLPIGFYLR